MPEIQGLRNAKQHASYCHTGHTETKGRTRPCSKNDHAQPTQRKHQEVRQMRPRYLDFIVRILKPAEPHCLDCKIGRIRTFSRPYRACRIARAGKYLGRKMVGARHCPCFIAYIGTLPEVTKLTVALLFGLLHHNFLFFDQAHIMGRLLADLFLQGI